MKTMARAFNPKAVENMLLTLRTGARSVIDIPAGSKLAVFNDKVVITHLEHEPIVINGTLRETWAACRVEDGHD